MTQFAHAGPDESNRRTHHGADSFSWPRLLRDLFPQKTAANVASLARTKVRAAEYVVSGESQPSTSALINLLRSPVGNAVLDALLDGVEWRVAERRLLEIHEHEQKLEKLKQEIRELDRATSLRR